MTRSTLELSRDQILAFRWAVNALDERLPPGPDALRTAAWAGLQDSMPRAALLSIHARVSGTEPSTWADPSLVQLWGPRFSAYVVAVADHAVFSLGRLPEDATGLRRAVDTADRLEAFLDGRRMTYGEAGDGLRINPNALRYAAPTGRVLIHWDGARQPLIWTVRAPGMDPRHARLELARRYLHLFGPGTPEAFAVWAGIASPTGRAAFQALEAELTAVRTPVGDAWILSADELAFQADSPPPADTIRLLPSGDTWFLLQGRDRDLLVPEVAHQGELWTSRVWPGAVLVAREIVGTWRRGHAKLSISPWRALATRERAAVEAEASTLPLPGLEGQIVVRWDD
jgi:hypothetical protein